MSDEQLRIQRGAIDIFTPQKTGTTDGPGFELAGCPDKN